MIWAVTPAEAIADLDRSLAADGEDIRLQRLTLAAGGVQIPFEVTCRACVRGYQPKDLVGGITQQDSKVILSPTEIVRAGWPGAASAAGTDQDRRVPRKGDRAIIAGRPRNIEAAVGIYVGSELVRIEMRVLG